MKEESEGKKVDQIFSIFYERGSTNVGSSLIKNMS